MRLKTLQLALSVALCVLVFRESKASEPSFYTLLGLTEVGGVVNAYLLDGRTAEILVASSAEGGSAQVLGCSRETLDERSRVRIKVRDNEYIFTFSGCSNNGVNAAQAESKKEEGRGETLQRRIASFPLLPGQ